MSFAKLRRELIFMFRSRFSLFEVFVESLYSLTPLELAIWDFVLWGIVFRGALSVEANSSCCSCSFVSLLLSKCE